MSRKHNTKHPQRVATTRSARERGLTNVDVRMPDLATLRKWAQQRGEYQPLADESLDVA